jgi:hypothetical protein
MRGRGDAWPQALFTGVEALPAARTDADARLRSHHRSRLFPAVAVTTIVMLSINCGGPTTPTPPPPAPPAPNAPPVIKSMTLSQRTIEVGQTVQVTAEVEDQESSIDKLQFVWSSPSGSFAGQGPTVTWQPSANLTTPGNAVVTVTVVESYFGLDSQNRTIVREHRVEGSTSIRVHNSAKELGDMGLSFLTKFANSSTPPEACVVDFSDNCVGKREELGDIQRNREKYQILSSSLGTPRFTRLRVYDDAEMRIACAFESRIVRCLPGEVGCVAGSVERVSGDCRVTGVYEQSRWWLCVSNFLPPTTLSPAMRDFFGADVKR